jgi:hypothetical protein
MVCLRQPGLKKAKNVRSLSPPSGAPRRISAIADEKDSDYNSTVPAETDKFCTPSVKVFDNG